MTGEAQPPVPSLSDLVTQDVIIDTDIGTDIDDAYAVLLALGSPELRIRGITLVHADIETRARIALKLLKLAGRSDIPVLPGESKPMNPDRPLYWGGHEGRGLDFADVESEVASLKMRETAVEFIARTVSESPGEVVLIPIGPLTNIGIAIRDFPKEMGRVKGIVCMGSTFQGFGRENAGVEHNIKLDPEAAKIVLESGIPILLVGLNVTLQTWLTEARVNQLAETGTPLAQYVAFMTRDWYGVVGRTATCMHDPLAVAAAYRPDLVESVHARAEVDLENAGSIAYFEADESSPVRICTSVDVEAFHELFYSRIGAATVSS